MANPQSPVGSVESSNEERENEGSLGSYDSPSDPYPSPKMKQSSSPQDEDYIPEEDVYEH
jgi:hypothetical protein